MITVCNRFIQIEMTHLNELIAKQNVNYLIRGRTETRTNNNELHVHLKETFLSLNLIVLIKSYA